MTSLGDFEDTSLNTFYSLRLILKRIEKEDLNDIYKWSNSAESYGHYLSPEKNSFEKIKKQLSKEYFWNNNSKTFIIKLRDTGSIGTIHYWLKSDDKSTAVVSIKIAVKELRGQGLGYEAQKAMVIYLFTRESVKQIEMYTDLDNIPEQKCLKKLSFEFIESLHYQDHGIIRQGNLYRITKNTFKDSIIYKNVE